MAKYKTESSTERLMKKVNNKLGEPNKSPK